MDTLEQNIRLLVQSVLSEMDLETPDAQSVAPPVAPPPSAAASEGSGIFPDVDSAVAAARQARSGKHCDAGDVVGTSPGEQERRIAPGATASEIRRPPELGERDRPARSHAASTLQRS